MSPPARDLLWDGFIGGCRVAPAEGRSFDDPGPAMGEALCPVPRPSAADTELALDATHKPKDAWGRICAVLEPAEQTPLGILAVTGMVAVSPPPGVVEAINGFGLEASKLLAQAERIAKVAFTGETATGGAIMRCRRPTRFSARRSRVWPCSPWTRAKCAPV